MKLINTKPYLFLWISSAIILIAGYINYVQLKNSALDINIHDTYFVIAHELSVYGLSIFFFSLGLIYLLLAKLKIKLVSKLTTIHVIITLSSIILYILGAIYYDETDILNLLENKHLISSNTFNTMLGLIITIVQLIFIINIIFSTIKHGLQRTTSK